MNVTASRVTTASGTIYEFELHAEGGGDWGRVRKVGKEWTHCNMLTDIEVGGRMVMVLGYDESSPVRTTSRVASIERLVIAAHHDAADLISVEPS